MQELGKEEIKEILRSVTVTGQINSSFSQLGEDRILWWLFHQLRDGFYVDIGCFHPYLFSNTAILHLVNGWRGINVDVDERAITAFRRERPGDVSICAAIGGSAGRTEATIFEHGAFNTLDAARGEQVALSGFAYERKLVDVLPLRNILHKYVPAGRRIDFLNVDIEGLDHIALMSNDWDAFMPTAIAVEIHGFDLGNPTSNPTYELLTSKGYQLLSHMVATSIFHRP